MHKIRNLIWILFLIGLLAGCSAQEPMVVLDLTDGEEPALAAADVPPEATGPLMTIYLYTGNGIISDSTRELTPEWLVTKLAQQLVIPDTVNVLSFSNEDNKLAVDFSQALGDHILSMGTYGESLTIQCVVNTFLDAYDAESMTFTVEGQPLATGHNIYDYPQTYLRNYLD